MITPTEFEQQAREGVLPALGDQLIESGLDKPLAEYTQDEIMALVNALFDAYHQRLQQLYDQQRMLRL